MPGFPVHRQLPELAQTHVHRVSDAIQQSPFLDRLIRSPGSPKEEKGVGDSQGGDRSLELSRRENDTLFFPTFLKKDYDFQGGSDDKASACNEGDQGSIPGSGRCTGEGNGNPLQHSCLENPMERGA